MKIQIEVSKEAGVKFKNLIADTQSELFTIVDDCILTMPVEDSNPIRPCRSNAPNINATSKRGLTRRSTPPSSASSAFLVLLLLSALNVFSLSNSSASQAGRSLPGQECPVRASDSRSQPSNQFWRAASDRPTSIRPSAGLQVPSNKEGETYLLRLAASVSSFSVCGVCTSEGEQCR